MTHEYNGPYHDTNLNYVAFPLGGIGAGMLCLEGTGAFSHVSLRGRPQLRNEPLMFAALCLRGRDDAPNVARVLEGPVPRWKVFCQPEAGNGLGGKHYGLPHCAEASFEARFPFGNVTLRDPKLPLEIELTGWSPFAPGDPDNASLPVAGLEYRFRNVGDAAVDAVFSFHARNFMATETQGEGVRRAQDGFVLRQPGDPDVPWDQGAFSVTTDAPEARVNAAWFRGGWFDALTLVWKSVAAGATPESDPPTEGRPSPGGSLYVPLYLLPGAEKEIRLRLAWHVPTTDLRLGSDPDAAGTSCCCATAQDVTHTPWYAGVFPDVAAVADYWREQYDALRAETTTFTDAFYDTTLPPEVVEAIAANLTILKSPTVQRQADGRLWCWEGCCEVHGCCHGSCTHVWNYAQALPHLFPSLERTLRETEFFVNQNAEGHQAFRASLPIREPAHDFHAAADGQLGGVMKVYREWRISGDEAWLRELWPRVKQSLAYCIATWDPDHTGTLVEPHHNTYDVEFWGPDGMTTSFYLGALKAATLMADALGDTQGDDVSLYHELLAKGIAAMESELWNGEYFVQEVRWQGLRTDPTEGEAWNIDYSPEARALLEREGPKYQYGNGCLADGVLGAWIAAMCGVPAVLDAERVRGHLLAVHRHNLRHDLSEHANPQRPTFAMGHDGGLLLCTWPHGDALTLPFPYANEVWTGFEYQAASHLILMGEVDAGLEIVRVARDRYDGRDRNPFDEYECGHWYARAMASYGLIQALTGVRYDAVTRTLHLAPRIPGDVRAFLSTATGFGTVGVKDGEPFVEVKQGTIPYEEIVYIPCEK